MSGAPPRARRMVSLGKVTAPKPVNLPSQKKENNGNDPTVSLVPKGSGTWGDSSYQTPLTEGGARDSGGDAPRLPPRAIPAAPSAAWGGAGLPEERKRALELASREEFPILTSKDNLHERQRSRPPSEGRQAAWDDDERSFAGPPEDRDSHGPRGDRERWGEPGGYPDRDRYGPYDRYGHGPPDRERYGPADWDRYGPPERGRQPPPEWERYGPDERFQGYRDGPGPYDRERYDRHGPPDDRYGPPPRGDRYGLPPPPREHGYPDDDYHGPPRRPYDGPPSRGDSDYERDHRRPYPDHDGPPQHRGPAQGRHPPPRDYEYGRPGPDYYPRAPPPPPPPRRKEPGPDASSLAGTPPAANGATLERSASLQSGSTQLSDSTAASSRRATLGSSMPRSDWGSTAGEVPTLDDHRDLGAEQESARAGPKAVGQEGQDLTGQREPAPPAPKPDLRERPDMRERPRMRVPPGPAQQQEQQRQKQAAASQMRALGPAPARDMPAPAAARPERQPSEPSAQHQPQHVLQRPSEAPSERMPSQASPQQQEPLSPSQQAGPTRILRRDPQPASAQETPTTAPAAATSIPSPPAQHQQQATIRPPPPPPPRQQQQGAANAQVAAEAAARMAQLNLAAAPTGVKGAAAQPAAPEPRTPAWGGAQAQSRPQQQQQQRQQLASGAPVLGGGWQQGVAAPRQPGAVQREEGNRVVEDVVQLGGGLSLPSQDSLMHHIASPERQPMLRHLPPPPQQQSAEMGGIVRSMLPQAMPMPAHPPVSVTAHFAPQQPAQGGQQQQQQQQPMPMTLAGMYGAMPTGMQVAVGGGNQQQQQQQQQRAMYSAGAFLLPHQHVQGAGIHPSLLGLPAQQQLMVMQQQQQQQGGMRVQGLPGMAGGPATSMPQPLMTFGSMPQAPVSAGVRMPVSLPAPQAAQQPALQFGNVVLPSAIEGSVESEVPADACQGLSPTHELTAEQQHAFMKAKAAEKARLLQEQEARRKQEEERRSKHKHPGERLPQPSLPHHMQQQQQHHMPATLPPPPPPRAGAPAPKPGRGRDRGRGEGGAQQSGGAPGALQGAQGPGTVDDAVTRGKGTAGRGGRGGRGRGRGRGDSELGDGGASGSAPAAAVLEVRKPAAKQQRGRPDRGGAEGSGVTAPPPGLGHSEGSRAEAPPARTAGSAPAATATVVVERKRSGGGKQGAKGIPAPGLSRQADGPQAPAAETNGTGEGAAENGTGGRGGRGGRGRGTGGRGGRPQAAADSAHSNNASEAGEGSKAGSKGSSGQRGRGRGAPAGRAAGDKPAGAGRAEMAAGVSA